MNQCERVIFDKIKTLINKAVENTDMTVEVEESDDEGIHAFFENIGEYEGSMLVEVNFIDSYKKEDTEVLQFFSSLSADIDEKFYPRIMQKLNELNAMTLFGSFILHPESKRIFHKYMLPIKKGVENTGYDNIEFIWEELLSTLLLVLPYVLVISFTDEDIDFDKFVEAVHEIH
jgi:hypothetical protein